MSFKATGGASPRLKALEDVLKLDASIAADVTRIADSVFKTRERTKFASEGASDAAAWPALSPAYAKQKAKKYPGRKILVMTGALRDGVSTESPGHVAQTANVGEGRWLLTLGAVGPYWWTFHVTGTSKMPARDPIARSPEAMAAYRDAVRRALAPHISARVRALVYSGRL